jgi:diadenosine tetraphosphate (Ap4A) HIT family hydrolase
MSLLSRDEYEEWTKRIPPDYCPICHPSEQILLGKTKHFFWFANISPYWKYHTMIVPKRHVDYFSRLTNEELIDFQKFLKKITKHLLSLELTYDDGTAMTQFLTMFRESADKSKVGYYKMDHLHIHLVPEKRGVDRFKIDPEAIHIEIEKIRFR